MSGITIHFENRAWQLDLAHVMLQDAMAIQLYTGLSIGDWEDSIEVKAGEDGKLVNPPPEWLKSVAALYWLMKAQNDVRGPIAEVNFDVPGFLVAFMGAMEAELARRMQERAPEPDPTSPSPSLRGDPPSPEPATRTATTRQPRARQREEEAAIA